jgi:hypothetical protein
VSVTRTPVHASLPLAVSVSVTEQQLPGTVKLPAEIAVTRRQTGEGKYGCIRRRLIIDHHDVVERDVARIMTVPS